MDKKKFFGGEGIQNQGGGLFTPPLLKLPTHEKSCMTRKRRKTKGGRNWEGWGPKGRQKGAVAMGLKPGRISIPHGVRHSKGW